eukprot:g16345.t1
MYMGPLNRFKFQDASHYLELAGQCFRVAKRFQDAGVAYKQCGRLEEKLKNPEVAASFYHEAALCFQKDDPQEAAACYLSAINLFCQKHRFSTAARLECEVAELMQNDRNRRLAIVHYIKAAYFYRANTCCDEATDRCLLKAAHALGLGESYVEAATLFEEVGRRMLVDDLLKFNTPDAFLKAALCLQCASGMPEPTPDVRHRKPEAEDPLPRPTINIVKAKIVALGKASTVFQGSRAYMFAMDMASAGKDGDVDFFASRLYAYNNVFRLDAWYLRILKKVGDHIQAKAVKMRKLKAIQDKMRRRQQAEERARERIQRRQNVTIQDDSDSSEGSLSERNASASSDETLPANTSSKPKPATPSSSQSPFGSASQSGSDSISDDNASYSSASSSGTEDSTSSGASSSPSESASGSDRNESGSAEETMSTETASSKTESDGENSEESSGREFPSQAGSSSLSPRSDSYSRTSNSARAKTMAHKGS